MLSNDVTYSIPWINVNLVLLHKLYNVDAIRFASMIGPGKSKAFSWHSTEGLLKIALDP